MILMIDNYDSFTFNIVQYLGQMGEDVQVYRNDKITLDGIHRLRPQAIFLSPGPCSPREAGITVDVVREFYKTVPIMGICLGHQSIGYAFGGDIVCAGRIMHGKVSPVNHDGQTIFTGLPNPFTAGPHPYPMMVRNFQSVIGLEIKKQLAKMEGRNPDVLVACVGGGSNAMGTFYAFRNEKKVAMFGVEAAGLGINTQEHSASINGGQVGVLHGNKTYLLQDEHGQVRDAYSIAAGLDYLGVGPEHAYFAASGRATYVTVTDDEAVEAFSFLSRQEGIIPALESAHAIAYAIKIAPQMKKNNIIVICLSGRGDKDAQTIIETM